MATTLVVCLLLVCVLILVALFRKGDVRANLKIPLLLSFSLDARGKRLPPDPAETVPARSSRTNPAE